jgi:glycerol-3-phosphate acyltransferase PlsY
MHALLPFTLAVVSAIIWLHRANIGRLRNGTENRVGRRDASGSASR